MKTSARLLSLLLVLTGASLAWADNNVLKNGDFSNGITEWEGDLHTPASVTFDSSVTNPPTTGVVVKLHREEWTRVTQDFDGNIGEYTLTITYSLSDNLKFSDRQENYTNIPALLGYNRLAAFNGKPGDWVVIINDLGAGHFTYWKIKPKADTSGPLTFTSQIQLESNADQKKGFYLCLPPGDGYINIQSISLTPQGGGSSQ